MASFEVVGRRVALAMFVLYGSVSLLVPASGAASVGGAAAPEPPRIDALRCGPSSAVCRRGQLLAVVGPGMQGAETVVFLGRHGTRDDRRARPQASDSAQLTVQVPAGAHSGRVKVVTRSAGTARSSTPLKVRSSAPAATPAAPARTGPTGPNSGATGPGAPGAPVAGAGIFPIQGAHTYGETSSNVFTGKGRHAGNDVFAACGTPLVAPQAATVLRTAFQSRAGNYVVLTADDGRSFAYMHMRDPSTVVKGQRLAPGQPVGAVGQTGRATGCHLHFELWTAPGWYQGGEPVDPRAQLKAWDAPAAPAPG